MAGISGGATGGVLHRRGVTGAAFGTDFSTVGSGTTKVSNQIFGGVKTNILDEERRLIEKVFSIVDKDKSGTVDTKELEEMFVLFGIGTTHLSAAINRIMANVDQDHDGQISPSEFYKLLSQKFEKGDPRSEIENVFHRMDKKRDNELDVDELYEVSQMLGENMSKNDIKEMITNFKLLYQEKGKLDGSVTKNLIKSSSGFKDSECTLNVDEFYHVMQVEL